MSSSESAKEHAQNVAELRLDAVTAKLIAARRELFQAQKAELEAQDASAMQRFTAALQVSQAIYDLEVLDYRELRAQSEMEMLSESDYSRYHSLNLWSRWHEQRISRATRARESRERVLTTRWIEESEKERILK